MPLDKDKLAAQITKELAEQGKLIEGGWAALRLMAIPPDAPDIQIRAMRMAYMAGAQHLWASIMAIFDSGEEPTQADLKKMELINTELEAWADTIRSRKG